LGTKFDCAERMFGWYGSGQEFEVAIEARISAESLAFDVAAL
jgi:hypothetical protein